MPIERMLLAIEKLFSFDKERRDPGRIVRVNTPWKFDERIALLGET